RQGLLLSGPGDQECAALDGAEGIPGPDQRVWPARVREMACRVPAYTVAGSQGAGRGVPDLGSAGRRAKDEVALSRRGERDGTLAALSRRLAPTVDAAFQWLRAFSCRTTPSWSKRHETRFFRAQARPRNAAVRRGGRTGVQRAVRADDDDPARGIHRAPRALRVRQVDGVELHRRPLAAVRR